MGAGQSACQVLDFKLVQGSSPTDLSLRLHYNGTSSGKVSVELLPNKFFQERELATDLMLAPEQYRNLPFRRTVRPDAKLINREANSTVRVCTSINNCCDYSIDESKYLDFPVMMAPEMVSATREAGKRSVPPTVLMLGVPGGGKSTLTNELIALLEGKPCGQVFHAPTCGFGSTCTIVLHNIMAKLPGKGTADMPGNGGRVRFIDPPGIGPNAKTVKLGMEQVEWMLQGNVEAGSSLNYEWRGDNSDEGKREMHPHVTLVLVKVSDLMGGTDEWTVNMVPKIVRKANDYGVRVMIVLTYPNRRWPQGPSDVPPLDKSRVLDKAQTLLGVQSRDMFFFWPYLDPSEERHVVKEATSAAILAGALERAIPRMDERERTAAVKQGKQRAVERELEMEKARIKVEAENRLQARLEVARREEEREREAAARRDEETRRLEKERQLEAQKARLKLEAENSLAAEKEKLREIHQREAAKQKAEMSRLAAEIETARLEAAATKAMQLALEKERLQLEAARKLEAEKQKIWRMSSIVGAVLCGLILLSLGFRNKSHLALPGGKRPLAYLKAQEDDPRGAGGRRARQAPANGPALQLMPDPNSTALTVHRPAPATIAGRLALSPIPDASAGRTEDDMAEREYDMADLDLYGVQERQPYSEITDVPPQGGAESGTRQRKNAGRYSASTGSG